MKFCYFVFCFIIFISLSYGSRSNILIEINNTIDDTLWNYLQQPGFDVWFIHNDKITIALENEDVLSQLTTLFPSLSISIIPFDFDSVNQQGKEISERTKPLSVEIDNMIKSNLLSHGFINSINPIWFENYHTYDDIVLYINALHAAFPDRTELFSIGTSYEGVDIMGIRISASGFSDDKPEMIYNACQHAREWISPATALYFANSLLTNSTNDDISLLLDNYYYSIIPVVNVDGYKYTWSTDRLWRKNRTPNANSTCIGTDINRNWGYNWGGVGASTDPCSNTYRGASSFSEPEPVALSNYIKSFSNIAGYIDFHSYGQLILLPWCFTPVDTPDNTNQFLVGDLMAASIVQVHGKDYTPGDWFTTLYPSSGTSIDWVYGENLSVFSYTIELRDRGFYGFELPPDQIIPTGEEILAALITFGYEVASL